MGTDPGCTCTGCTSCTVIEPQTIDLQTGAKKTLVLAGLGCANCAAKIEHEVNKLAGVQHASLDFVAKRLIIYVYNERGLGKITSQATEIINKFEPDVEVIEEYGAGGIPVIEDEVINKNELIKIGVGAVLFAIALIFEFSFWTEFSLFLVSYLLVGGDILLRAVRNISRGQVFDENFLMSVATIGAFAIRQFPEGVAVMLFFKIGEFFEDLAVNRSRRSISSLMDIRPDYANLQVGDDIKRVSPEGVRIGDLIIVKPGERVPLDGIVVEGRSMVDTSALTGESVPRDVEQGSDILGGFINQNGLLKVQVTKKFGETTVSKILDLVQNAGSKKAPTENFITKFARYYTPVVVFGALAIALIPPLLIQGAAFSEWIYRALVFLVISCPCALVISIPLGFFGGIGGASKKGILIKGGNYLEALNNVDTVVFDKTGTLTKGVFKVTEVVPEDGFGRDDLLEMAAYAEVFSNHPIALSILRAYGKAVNKELVDEHDEVFGHGIKAAVGGREILAGNSKLMSREDIACDDADAPGTVVYVALDKTYAGYIVISDEIKEDSIDAINALKNIGIRKTVMLTGDNRAVGEKVAEELGLDEVYTELLPDQKVKQVEQLEKEVPSAGKLVFVGDGINDAPVLARADIGVAMGALGSDAAIEAADVVLMTDEPSQLVGAIKIAKRTKNIVWQNIVFALGVKGIVLVFGAMGIATMWAAVFADVGVALIAVLNATRAMYVKA
ncbi:heavy metal translocating P-type ATPase [Syntrophaceticus schinkii]|uniref:Cadmium, zinc and cobalt-transporting ATPase n=1 Tax=Syntrophaceticus schinkii TaxID=499207 RepID=A0A0B7MHH2_9FIRM|nr:heavy metal translocating P-type ATPase [Syntrophaceticus schinkii]CEO90084.1 Cadmium, zinc and cobalt-transporting ATPase [Syntrophaceticus schinkii]